MRGLCTASAAACHAAGPRWQTDRRRPGAHHFHNILQAGPCVACILVCAASAQILQQPEDSCQADSACCRKKQAVEAEDYDAAKQLKSGIDALRAQAAEGAATPRGQHLAMASARGPRPPVPRLAEPVNSPEASSATGPSPRSARRPGEAAACGPDRAAPSLQICQLGGGCGPALHP